MKGLAGKSALGRGRRSSSGGSVRGAVAEKKKDVGRENTAGEAAVA